MDQSLFLIIDGQTAADADESTIADAVASAFETAAPQAMLVARGNRSDSEYARLALEMIAFAQPRGCAVLLDNAPDKVAEWRADGVHITGTIADLRAAVDALKPDFIVGAGDIGSRHAAMECGELELDYLMFGDRDGDGAEMAAWWVQTFEIPAVYLAADADDSAAATLGTEFVARLLTDWPGASRADGPSWPERARQDGAP